ncbi:DUF2061 domain-containing protein [Acidisphaera sp. S103]|uniref:DUF2061 domain-containing protein n=1 Tax=Acidisphaera sp. S103 TaxID=1747223 RepID=UPI00131DD0B6|nr:DUF2061 domain-containing protein [Acidisphaera sp. S103]
MLAGAALLEVALIPGMVIGGAAMLVPGYLPTLRRRLFGSTARRRNEPAVPMPRPPDVKTPLAARVGFPVKQALAKTVTYRAIVTVLDFTSNYVVLGEAATAAGLSAFALVAGPLFYLAHETAWHYWGPAGTAVPLSLQPNAKAAPAGRRGITVNRALAKTVTFRTIASTVDFTTLYVVVGDFATAAGLSAFGLVVGPFVYLGHEMAWDYYGSPIARTVDATASTSLGPAPGSPVGLSGAV